MRLDEIGQGVEAKVVTGRLRERHGRAGAFLAVAPVNPARGEADRVRGAMIVEQALRGVQDLALLDAQPLGAW